MAKHTGSTQWYLIARFTSRADKDAVYFVKTQESSRGQELTCTCDTFAANLVNRKATCRHTKFCKLKVIDHEGSIPIEKLPPRRVAADKKLLNFWMERNVNTYLIE